MTIEKYDLEEYHSGGGCFHLSYYVDSISSEWLINDVDKDLEPSMEYPTDENQNCGFCLWIGDLDSDTQNRIDSLELVGSGCSVLENNGGNLIFYANLIDGVPFMREITKMINGDIK